MARPKHLQFRTNAVTISSPARYEPEIAAWQWSEGKVNEGSGQRQFAVRYTNVIDGSTQHKPAVVMA
jgi:hypothetical protein